MNIRESSSDQESASERVVNSTAAYLDVDSLELPPLYDAIDPDALNAAIASMGDGALQFQYAELFVTVRSTGSVVLFEDSAREIEATGTVAAE